MNSPSHPLIFPQLSQAIATPDALAWESFRSGIAIHRLYHSTSDGAAAALLRYAPGASVPRHRHLGYEHIWVLSGSQEDEHGRYEAGTLIINPPDTCHQVFSPDGCVVLVIWEKAVQFEP